MTRRPANGFGGGMRFPSRANPGSETWSGDSWKTGGGDTWLTGSYDPELNLIYWGIGNPAPDFDGDVRKGDNLYTECMVALDADTGKMKWYFQYTPHDVHDWDAVEIPVLVDAHNSGRTPQAAGPGESKRILLCARSHERQVPARHAVHQSINWAKGLTPEGRPIRVPGGDSRAFRARAPVRLRPAPQIGTRPPTVRTPVCST